jgi:hypothetical protein
MFEHTPTPYEVKKINAIKELRQFISFKANQCMLDGWSYELNDNAPESFKALKATTKNKHLLISTDGNSTSIYGERVNSLFRFYHDVTHITLDSGFSLEGETKVINQHIAEAIDYGLSSLALEILKADTLGQVHYYYKNKRFVSDQVAFIDCVLNNGLKNTLKVKV